MYFYPAPPPDDDQGWYPPATPVGTPHVDMIADPNYRYPLMTGSLGTAPTFSDARTSTCGAVGANPACTSAALDATCLNEATNNVPSVYSFMPTMLATPAKIYCYNPGIYDTTNSKQLSIGPAELVILRHGAAGAYYFKSGMDVGGRLIGGYQAGAPGVALMFDEAGPGNCSYCIFATNSALVISINAGTKYPATATTGAAATAARDWNNVLVETSGPFSPSPPILMSVLVKKDTNGSGGAQGCVVPTGAGPYVEPTACDANKDKTLSLLGNANIILEGVQYAPTDNIEIGGNSSSTGRVGQVIAWTLKYSGGIRINQEGPGSEGNGILRIDAACSAPGEPCTP
jgi:hypothetical protein